MYPRNAASPPRIAIGPVVQISDGAVQTSGCTVRVMEQGGAEGDGGGTTAYSTDGIVLYTPTQAETDQIAFIVIAKKTGCIPVSQTIITSASDVTGYVGLDWSKINAPTTTVGLTGTTIATTQKVDVETIKTNAVVNGGTVTFPTNATLASTTNITAGTVTTATNVTTVNGLAANVITAAATAADFGAEMATAIWTDTTAGDFTVAASVGKSVMNGVSLGTGLTVAAVSGAVGSVTGNVGGNVTGSVGSIATGGIAAASFAAGAIDASAIAADAIGASELAADAANEIADALLDRSNGIETGLTPRNALRLIGAASAGKLSGAATTTVVVRNAVADSKDRITATVDADGNRSAITTDLT